MIDFPESVPASGSRVAIVIARRELLRFWRQPARIAAAIGTPLLLWLLMASGLASSFSRVGDGEVGYAAFLLPGMMTLVAVFSAIFSSISVIEDRNEGWLQSVLVAPVPRWSIAGGKVLGGSIMAFAQAMLLLPALPLLGVELEPLGVGVAILALGVTCIATTAMGVAFAWVCETTSSFHAVMNLVFMPMWLLSGAFFPMGGASPWLAWLMRANPLAWATSAIRNPIIGEAWPVWLGLTAVFALVMLCIAVWVVARPRR